MPEPIRLFVVICDLIENTAVALAVDDLEQAFAGYRNLRREKQEIGRNHVEVLIAGVDDLMTLERMIGASLDTRTNIAELTAFDRP